MEEVKTYHNLNSIVAVRLYHKYKWGFLVRHKKPGEWYKCFLNLIPLYRYKKDTWVDAIHGEKLADIDTIENYIKEQEECANIYFDWNDKEVYYKPNVCFWFINDRVGNFYTAPKTIYFNTLDEAQKYIDELVEYARSVGIYFKVIDE